MHAPGPEREIHPFQRLERTKLLLDVAQVNGHEVSRAYAPRAMPLKQPALERSLLHQLAEFLPDRLAPDIVPARGRVEVVGAEGVGEEGSRFIEELLADVEVEDILLIVEAGDDLVGFGDLGADGVIGGAAGENGQEEDFGSGDILAEF